MTKRWEIKAMVTGGAGFIGSHLIDYLLRAFNRVVSIDNYSSGKHENLAHLKGNEHFQEIECDITDYDALKKHMEGVTIILHNAASKKNICLEDPRRDLEVNARGTLNVLMLAKEFNVRKVIHASTGSVYGEGGRLSEDHPLNPVSYYGVSKLAGERYALAFSRLYDMDITVLRYFHVYGPRQDCGEHGGVISIFTNKILNDEPITIFGDGTQQRSFTYVDDVVEANKFVANNKGMKGRVFNCASGVKIELNEAIEQLGKIAGKRVKRKYDDWSPGDIKRFDVDNSKLCNLGFKYNVGFLDGLKRTVNYFNPSSCFYTKGYESYNNYIEHQKSKFNKDMKWFEKYKEAYYKLICHVLANAVNDKFLKLEGANVLCLGARDGTEVRAFCDLGAFCVGLDLNTGKDNKYVVTGDASNIQYPDNSVDIVYTNALDHFLRIEETINEIKRVLRPDGHFVFIIGTSYDAEHDKYGSTYWDDDEQVDDYLANKHKFKKVTAKSLKGSNFFSRCVIMQNKK